jgi:hypothetical protein
MASVFATAAAAVVDHQSFETSHHPEQLAEGRAIE